jgi:hypothetical protein
MNRRYNINYLCDAGTCADDSMGVTARSRAGTGGRSASTASRLAMAKRSGPSAKPIKHRAPAPPQGGRPFALNPNLNRQTRKILSKHYRAKYGVK